MVGHRCWHPIPVADGSRIERILRICRLLLVAGVNAVILLCVDRLVE